MTFLFGNDERRKLVQIAITNNDESGCFGSPFDLLGAKFFCGVSEEGFLQTLNLGDSYKEALQKSGIKADLPITYGNDFFIQLTNTTGIGWKRDNYEEKPENIPEDSYLALVTMRNNYTVPFLLDHSLIKVNLKDNNTVHLIKDPIDPEKNMMEDIEQKLMVVRCQEDIKGIKQELADVQSQEDIKGYKTKAGGCTMSGGYKTKADGCTMSGGYKTKADGCTMSGGYKTKTNGCTVSGGGLFLFFYLYASNKKQLHTTKKFNKISLRFTRGKL